MARFRKKCERLVAGENLSRKRLIARRKGSSPIAVAHCVSELERWLKGKLF
jgi:hypothetical protein